ncbi:pyrroline-5-carboxylate reductase [Neisseria animalis]|uniref:Pyrroline-5-carboxylate reductase n=1 Tax=Neisseria animalis TaxID=492 RepID=A0A5P3MTX0_NEIAN|nr:pyrroline-5-carboxylate reductase [Neisseria animalis]QEY24978.1 pyrroline-5-carboxylate reductase [Neisseria animalis]ROW32107.1 pyrroline-5-carboxylate reductase [Neisseria animalis]
MTNVYFLGGGNMAAAIAGGLVKQGGYRVHIANRGAEKRERLVRELGVAVSERLPVLGADDVLVLAVKPQDMQTACTGVETNGALVLSVAAGLSVNTLSRYLGGTRRIVRVMPNTPSQIGLGVSGLFAENGISDGDKRVAELIMQAVGLTIWLEAEADMHAITGISGSGPAYVFYLLNALQNAAKTQGFDEETARRLSLATFKGAVALAEQSGKDFAVLQQNVTSKGGTTHEAVETFKSCRVAEAIEAGVAACVARSQEMAQQYEAV